MRPHHPKHPVVLGLAALAFGAAALLPSAAAFAEDAEWIRYPAISPDGKRIVFTHRGDLWVVDTAGGAARQVTTHVGHERSAVWSPDGKTLAFAADWYGQFDVFTVSAEGGAATRLTWHSNGDVPHSFTPDGRYVVFSSTRQDAPEALLSSQWLPELYHVPVAGGRAKLVLTTPAESAVYSADGTRVLYQDRKAYEDTWRKHHTSSAARDVWMWTVATGEHVKLTTFPGEDRNPAWSADGRSFWYLSEESAAPGRSSFNVWKYDLASGGRTRVTSHETHPVRFLTAATDGTLAYSWHGQLHVIPPGGAPRRVPVQVAAGDRENPELTLTLADGATEMAPSPNGEEVAFIVRGDVYVASTDHGTTRRITATPGLERSLSWTPDGKSILYAAERGESWDLRRAVLAGKDDERFWNALEVREEPVLATADDEFQPVVSPDGKLVAYIRNRDEIAVLDLATAAAAPGAGGTPSVKTIVPSDRCYSYADGDIRFEWSPDSRWLAFNFLGAKRWIDDVGVADVASGVVTDLTDSGYEESSPHWTADGRALLFVSDRAGRKNHGSWGSDGDVFAQYLTQDSFDRSRLSREELALRVKREEKEKEPKKDDAAKPDEAKKDEAAKPGDAATAAGAPKPVAIEFEGRERRVRRLTTISGDVSSFAVSPDGEVVLTVAAIDGEWALWATKPRDGAQKKVTGTGGPGEIVFAKDGRSAYLLAAGGRIAKLSLGGLDGEGDVTADRKDVGFSAQFTVDRRLEREAIFEHAWHQAADKFYDPAYHGADWKAMHDAYARVLPFVSNGHEFAEVLSEMLGELNASHTGGRYRMPTPDEQKTAALGLLWDPVWTDEGLRVAEVLAGGPADRPGTKLTPGAVVLAVDGVRLAADMDPARALANKAGNHVVLTIRTPDGGTATERVEAIALDAEAELLYARWMRRCDAEVLRLSNGRVGWTRVEGMDDESFRTLFRDALGKHSDREALIVDTRWNGGGWLHEDLVSFLSGKEYLWFVPRGKTKGQMGAESARRWTRPSVVLMNEGNYSDAHVFPFAFRELGLGKLVGAPVAGTGTAVWWETQSDPQIVFGIPQVGLLDARGKYLENQELRPDVEVYQNPADLARGVDAQLAAAVKAALGE